MNEPCKHRSLRPTERWAPAQTAPPGVLSRIYACRDCDAEGTLNRGMWVAVAAPAAEPAPAVCLEQHRPGYMCAACGTVKPRQAWL